MTKAYSVMTVKSYTENEDERIIKGIASTPKPDRDNDIVDSKGATFTLPLPLLWQHDSNSPIGEVIEATVTDKGIEFTARIAKIEELGNLKNRIDDAWHSIKSGLVKCISVGFKALDYEYIKDSYGLHIKSWELYEISVVTIPANSDAIINSVKQIKKAFSDADTETSPVIENEPVIKTTTQVESTVPDDAAPVADSFITLVDPNQGSISLIDGETL